MNKSILITGVAGSGKSAICDELIKSGYKAFGIEEIDGLFKMVDKKTGKPLKNFDNNDLESVNQSRWICDKKKLEKLMSKNVKDLTFYCGIASNMQDLLPLFDKVFLLRANLKVLRYRLTTRTSNTFGKNPQVQKQIFSWKNWWEKEMIKKGAILINANPSIEKVTKEILKKSAF